MDPNLEYDHQCNLGELHPNVERLKKIKQHEQRSPEWFAQRKNMLTASDIDSVLGSSKYNSYKDILFKKCGIEKPFISNKFTRHGQKYEDEAIAHFCRIFNKKTVSFGLIPHQKYKFLGGSPDDVTTDNICLEVKCPYSRKIIPGSIPEHYINQLRINMEICDCDEGYFIEYIPPEMNYGERFLNVVKLQRDHEWFKRILPTLINFWNDVLYYRSIGIENHKDYKDMKEKTREKNILDMSSFSGLKLIED